MKVISGLDRAEINTEELQEVLVKYIEENTMRKVQGKLHWYVPHQGSPIVNATLRPKGE